jgi:hypothetical protein
MDSCQLYLHFFGLHLLPLLIKASTSSQERFMHINFLLNSLLQHNAFEILSLTVFFMAMSPNFAYLIINLLAPP